MTPVKPGRFLALAIAIGSLMTAAACAGFGDGDSTDGHSDLPDLSGETVSVAAVWGGSEQKVFEQVMSEFEKATGANMTFTSTGEDIATVLNTKLEADAAPDVAFLPQPGLMNG